MPDRARRGEASAKAFVLFRRPRYSSTKLALCDVHPCKAGCQHEDVTMRTYFNPGERLMQRTTLLRQWYPQREDDVRVWSDDHTTQPAPYLMRRHIPSENPRYLWSETLDLGEDTGQYDVTVTDGKTGVRYYFQHSYWDPGPANAEDAAIAESSRVLPLGTVPPTHP